MVESTLANPFDEIGGLLKSAAIRCSRGESIAQDLYDIREKWAWIKNSDDLAIRIALFCNHSRVENLDRTIDALIKLVECMN